MAELVELTPDVALIRRANSTRSNIYVVRSADGDTLVDPGPIDVAPAILALDRRGILRLRRIVITHAHPAHAGSTARIVRGTGVRTYVHPDDAPFLDGRAAPLLPGGRRGALLGALGRVIDLCPPVFGVELLAPGVPVGELMPIATPGHTPGHVCLLYARGGVLFCGDALVTDRAGLRLPRAARSADPERARSSLAALRGLDYQHLLPGHGPPLLGGAAARVDEFLRLLG
jgi:glyoxylase-like metal-dependent hydrolase (beta-lactamase superfamily II)